MPQAYIYNTCKFINKLYNGHSSIHEKNDKIVEKDDKCKVLESTICTKLILDSDELDINGTNAIREYTVYNGKEHLYEHKKSGII